MPNVNLLPWREEQRRQRQRGFLLAVCIAVSAGGAAVYAAKLTVQGLISDQHARNDVLRGEIAALDSRIEEIRGLEMRKESLLARMRIIVQLQRSRTGIVHVFDELAEVLPAGVHLVEVRQSGARIVLNGVAESSSRVSALMHNIGASRWLRDPGLELVETSVEGPTRKAHFTLFAEQTEGDGEHPPQPTP